MEAVIIVNSSKNSKIIFETPDDYGILLEIAKPLLGDKFELYYTEPNSDDRYVVSD